MRRKGFTLIELMVVILIVAILAAVVAPMLSGRINDAKWSEGKAGAGTIATALRAYMAENQGITGITFPLVGGTAPFAEKLGIASGDLDGKYFMSANYQVVIAAYSADTGTCTYTIRVGPGSGTGAPTGTKDLTKSATDSTFSDYVVTP